MEMMLARAHILGGFSISYILTGGGGIMFSPFHSIQDGASRDTTMLILTDPSIHGAAGTIDQDIRMSLYLT